MIHDDESALICDLAETYQIYDYRSLPVRMAATLAAGLRDTSRITTKTTEVKASTTNTILAIIADHLGAIRRILGDDTELHSVLRTLYRVEEDDHKDSNLMSFKTGADFDEWWQAMNEDNNG